MVTAAIRTTKAMSGFKLAYVQSDEATFLLTDYDKLESQGWFGYELNKLVSVSASHFTAAFNHVMSSKCLAKQMDTRFIGTLATFDARAFTVPREDVPNVFVWRQQDWYRNSVQMLAQSVWSPKQLHSKPLKEVRQMLRDNGTPWGQLESQEKYGTFIHSDGSTTSEWLDYDMLYELLREVIDGPVSV
jgi:tRNA(His) 5'-end guanylyltransferase